MNSLPQADQSKDLEFREDGLWYLIDQESPYDGAAVDFYENGTMKSRTKMIGGTAVGLIEEWDENGTVRGTRFKNEFPQ
jgi:antitoxin component YwqK of YwqJK toxin-antitoxin module